MHGRSLLVDLLLRHIAGLQQRLVPFEIDLVEVERLLCLEQRRLRVSHLVVSLTDVELRLVLRLSNSGVVGYRVLLRSVVACAQIGRIQDGQDLAFADVIAFDDVHRISRFDERAG